MCHERYALEMFTTHDFTDELQVSEDPADVRLVFETGHVADFSAVQVGWIFIDVDQTSRREIREIDKWYNVWWCFCDIDVDVFASVAVAAACCGCCWHVSSLSRKSALPFLPMVLAFPPIAHSPTKSLFKVTINHLSQSFYCSLLLIVYFFFNLVNTCCQGHMTSSPMLDFNGTCILSFCKLTFFSSYDQSPRIHGWYMFRHLPSKKTTKCS